MTAAIAALGTWPVFGVLILLCCLFFGYLVPKAKAPNLCKHCREGTA